MTVNKKIANASVRMLEILKLLMIEPISFEELLKALEKKTRESYVKETVNKYINTLKLLGFDIRKDKDKLYLNYGLEKIDLDRKDLSMMLFISKYTKQLNNKTLTKEIGKTLQIIEKSFSDDTVDLMKNIRSFRPERPIIIKDENISKFEQLCEERFKIEIFYKDSSGAALKYKIEPVNIVYKKGKAHLIGYNYLNNEYKEFLIQYIDKVKQLPQMSTDSAFTMPVTFKLKNRLANAYILKTGEQIIESGKDFIVVSNKLEDRNLLLKRLLRYRNECEILYPLAYRTRFVELIDEMVKIYE